jgi:hypothetical protein
LDWCPIYRVSLQRRMSHIEKWLCKNEQGFDRKLG